MRRWLARSFVWMWGLFSLRWVPARARLPVAIVVLYLCTATLLWRTLPPQPRLVLELPAPLYSVDDVIVSKNGTAVVADCETGYTDLFAVFDLRHRTCFQLTNPDGRLALIQLSPDGT